MSFIRLPFRARSGSRRIRVYRELEPMREHLDGERGRGKRIALVPTMGNLHRGHLSLVERAREVGDVTLATVFVNPFQFGQNEDFDTYPRTFDADVAALEEAGCDLLFAPDASLIYPRGPDAVTRVEVPELGSILCGATRPTFFRGVATVVNILLNMTSPDVAVFGEKDYQQLLVVSRMVEDLKMRVRIEPVATVREHDGLAMSSRNLYLTADERARAPRLYATLCELRDAVRAGGGDLQRLARDGAARLADAGLEPDYVTVRRQSNLQEPGPGDQDLIALAAARLGRTRLIDNVKI